MIKFFVAVFIFKFSRFRFESLLVGGEKEEGVRVSLHVKLSGVPADQFKRKKICREKLPNLLLSSTNSFPNAEKSLIGFCERLKEPNSMENST